MRKNLSGVAKMTGRDMSNGKSMGVGDMSGVAKITGRDMSEWQKYAKG